MDVNISGAGCLLPLKAERISLRYAGHRGGGDWSNGACLIEPDVLVELARKNGLEIVNQLDLQLAKLITSTWPNAGFPPTITHQRNASAWCMTVNVLRSVTENERSTSMSSPMLPLARQITIVKSDMRYRR